MTFLCSEGKNITSCSFSPQFAIIRQTRYSFFLFKVFKTFGFDEVSYKLSLSVQESSFVSLCEVIIFCETQSKLIR